MFRSSKFLYVNLVRRFSFLFPSSEICPHFQDDGRFWSSLNTIDSLCSLVQRLVFEKKIILVSYRLKLWCSFFKMASLVRPEHSTNMAYFLSKAQQNVLCLWQKCCFNSFIFVWFAALWKTIHLHLSTITELWWP